MTATVAGGNPGGTTDGRRLPRVESLTGLRWWAAFFVFAHHMTNLAPLPIHEFLRVGTTGVTFFFVLSGFVLTWSARPGIGAGTFYRHRFARIWPAYAVALLIALPVFYRPDPDPAMTWINSYDVGILVLCALLLQGWTYQPEVLFGGNPAGWTLSVEAFFYAYHPFVNRLVTRLRALGALTLCVLVIAAGAGYRLLRYHDPETWPLPALPVINSVAFLVGMGLAVAVRSGRLPRIPVSLAVAALAAGAMLIWRVAEDPAAVPGGTTLHIIHLEVLTVLYGLLIVAAATRDLRGLPSVLRSTVLVKLGQWSYAFYLLHATIIYAIRGQVGLPRAMSWENLWWYAGVLAVSIVLSWALYRFVEHPLERRLRNGRRKHGGAPVTER